jgi:RNA polymerase sigma factor (sigma-70 family)
LLRYLRLHGGRLGWVSEEDREDIAAQKSLELLGQIDSTRWQPNSLDREAIQGYLSTVARNGLVDRLRERGRQGVMAAPEEAEGSFPDRDGARQIAPDAPVACEEFAGALRECLDRLRPRAKRVWFLRVFFELASKEIAAHPEVRIRTTHVDVELARARASIRSCMQQKGFQSQDLPAGTFATLWESLRLFGKVGGAGRGGLAREIRMPANRVPMMTRSEADG